MKNIKVVEYQELYAAKIADMWNKSSENWGGYDSLKTDQDVINETRNSGDLNVYLALDEEEVVGYCSFSEYRQDEGACYIPLLNVRPDYHGKKVGKDLVLKAVDRAINSDWPRLDLYTWPGNTKAVPLYKKCGFFWEKRDDTTHLMNFIPHVLKTEAVKDYFNVLDWYKDSNRVIEVKTDGRKENDFEYFQYSWKKDDVSLCMEYERKGRGLRLIETNDYIVKATIKDQKLVFGKSYKINYEILNKSGKELHIKIKGYDDKNIKFNLDKEITVTDNEIIEGEFFVGEIKEEQSIWRTHPCVSSEIYINGKKSEFKLGIEPKFPVKMKMIIPDKANYKDVISKGYLDIENSFDEDITLNFNLQNSKIVEFINNSIELNIKAKEKISIQVEYKVKDFGFYSEDLNISIKLKDEEIKYTKKLNAAFKGIHGKFYGENDDDWMIFNGKYTVKLHKLNNAIVTSDHDHCEFETALLYPKLGMPYSLEFSKKKPDSVEYIIEDDVVIMEAIYNSRDFNNIKLISVIKLYPNGIIENYYEVYNKSESESSNDIHLSCNIFHSIADSYIPYDNKVIKIKGTDGAELSYWDNEKLTENWLFSKHESVSRGINWSDYYKLDFNGWYISLSCNLGKIKGNDFIKTESTFITWGSFSTWKEFRSFAMKNNKLKEASLIDDLHFEINNGNPFVKDVIDIRIKDYKKYNLEGKIKIKSENHIIDKIKEEIDTIDNEINLSAPINSTKNSMDIIKLKVDSKTKEIKKYKAVFKVTDNCIQTNTYKENNMDIYEADNGIIKIKAAPNFSNCLYSIIYKENEWLDTSYPTPKANAWWNPWSGGMCFKPVSLSYESTLKEKREVEFVKIKDNFNNEWEGIKISLTINENEKYKGLKLNQYFLMLPNAPIVLTTTEIEQNTGRYFNDERFVREIYLKSAHELTDSYFKISNEDTKYKCGVTEQEIFTHLPVVYGGNDREDKMIVLKNSDEGVYAYTSLNVTANFNEIRLSIENNSKVFSPSDFIIFNKKEIDPKLLNDFKNIKF